MPSLGLLYLAAVLEDKKIDVDVIDYQASRFDFYLLTQLIPLTSFSISFFLGDVLEYYLIEDLLLSNLGHINNL